MGVGVFRDTFKGTGSTIIISGPLPDDDDYQAYVDECDDDEAMSQMDWEQDNYDQFNADLVNALRSIGRDLDMCLADSSVFSTTHRAAFDSDFCAVVNDALLSIGWRSWQHDFVVGIGSDVEWAGQADDIDDYREELIRSYHLPAKVVIENYASLAEAAALYTRLSLQQSGFECRYPTSGYTSAEYTKPENLDAAIDDALATFKVAHGKLSVRDGLPATRSAPGDADRISLLEDLMKVADYNGRSWERQEMRPITLLYDVEDAEVVVVHALDNDAEMLRSYPVNDDVVSAHLASLGEQSSRDLVPLRFADPIMRPWLDAWLKDTPNPYWETAEILVDVDDIEVATKGEHTVDLDWDDDDSPSP